MTEGVGNLDFQWPHPHPQGLLGIFLKGGCSAEKLNNLHFEGPGDKVNMALVEGCSGFQLLSLSHFIWKTAEKTEIDRVINKTVFHGPLIYNEWDCQRHTVKII